MEPTDARFVRAAVAVAAPLAAEAGDRPADALLLCEDVLTTPLVQEAHLAALTLTALQIRRTAPFPADLLTGFTQRSPERYPQEVCTIGSSYLRAAMLYDSPSADEVWKVVVGASRSLDELQAIRGAVAATWWALVSAASALERDPLETAQELCVQLALLDAGS